MPRQLMTRHTDSRVFRRTAVKTRKVNLGTTMMRGGVRF